jgi:hypothetical protein
MDKIEKTKKIEELRQQQLKIMDKMFKISSLPPGKRESTSIKRTFKVLSLAVTCGMLEQQIKIISSQPLPKSFKDGGVKINYKNET